MHCTQPISLRGENALLEVIKNYLKALRAVRLVVAAIFCLGFCCIFIQTHVPLRKEHQSEFGLSEPKKETVPQEEGICSVSYRYHAWESF